MDFQGNRVFNVEERYISNPENDEFVTIYRNKLDNKYYGRRANGVNEPLATTSLAVTANAVSALISVARAEAICALVCPAVAVCVNVVALIVTVNVSPASAESLAEVVTTTVST